MLRSADPALANEHPLSSLHPPKTARPSSIASLVRGWGGATFLPLILAVFTVLAFSPGIGGGFLFDDYPNIVDNPLVQPASVTYSSLVAAAMSSPSSDLKRPLSSLSFALDYVIDGALNPAAMKCTNVFVHALNGVLVYSVFLSLLIWRRKEKIVTWAARFTAAAMALAWLLAPINVTPALYIVQRMESLANLFVLVGLLGFIHARTRMLTGKKGSIASITWIVIPTVLGVLAKETAVLMPLYAFFLEIFVFRFRATGEQTRADRRIASLYVVVLGIPMVGGLWMLGPGLIDPRSWATRDFSLRTRLLSECRVVLDYVQWTIFPQPDELSFYHDDFVQSTGWFSPVTTALSALALAGLAVGAWVIRRRAPLLSLGIAWFFACHTLTGTILPLELIYEHRNYFSSMGLVLAGGELIALAQRHLKDRLPGANMFHHAPVVFAAALLAWSAMVTTTTAHEWRTPITTAEELAKRGPDSPRAQYELGRAYIIASRYVPGSPYAELAYAPLEHAASLPGSSILPQQALIFLNSRMSRPVKTAWWDSMVAKLHERPATVQDESSLDALSRCLADQSCHFEASRLNEAINAALTHPAPTGRLLAIAASFARHSMRDESHAYALQVRAARASPNEPAYHIVLAQMARDRGDDERLREQLQILNRLNVGGRLDGQLATLRSATSTRL